MIMAKSDTTSRKCGKCDEIKDIDDFSFITTTGYYHSYCKICLNEYNKMKARERRDKAKEEAKNPTKVFADILARKRITEEQE